MRAQSISLFSNTALKFRKKLTCLTLLSLITNKPATPHPHFNECSIFIWSGRTQQCIRNATRVADDNKNPVTIEDILGQPLLAYSHLCANHLCLLQPFIFHQPPDSHWVIHHQLFLRSHSIPCVFLWQTLALAVKSVYLWMPCALCISRQQAKTSFRSFVSSTLYTWRDWNTKLVDTTFFKDIISASLSSSYGRLRKCGTFWFHAGKWFMSWETFWVSSVLCMRN